MEERSSGIKQAITITTKDGELLVEMNCSKVESFGHIAAELRMQELASIVSAHRKEAVHLEVKSSDGTSASFVITNSHIARGT